MANSGDVFRCQFCGAQYAPEHHFCGSCGAAVREIDRLETTPPQPAPTQRPFNPSEELDRLAGSPYEPLANTSVAPTGQLDDAIPYYIPTNRVVLLTVLSSGLYIFYWLYVTWRQYRDYTGETAFPVFHALCLIVPVYQFFRLHAHMQVYQELMEARSVPSTVSPLRAVLIYLGVVLLGLVSFMLPTEGMLTPSQQVAYVVINIGQTVLLAWMIWHAQTNINRLWQHCLGGRLGSTPLAPAEVVITILGCLFGWGMLAVILIDPTLLPSDPPTG